MDDKLLEILDQVVIDKTLSLEGLTALQKIKEELTYLRTIKDDQKEQITNLLKTYEESKKEKEDLKTQLATAMHGLQKLSAESEKVQKAIMTAEFSELRRQDCFELVKLIFRSPVLQKTISESSSIPVSVPGSATCGGYVSTCNKNKISTETEEIK